jgi:hypothetical protein
MRSPATAGVMVMGRSTTVLTKRRPGMRASRRRATAAPRTSSMATAATVNRAVTPRASQNASSPRMYVKFSSPTKLFRGTGR